MRRTPHLEKRPAGGVVLALTLLLCLGGFLSPPAAKAETRLDRNRCHFFTAAR